MGGPPKYNASSSYIGRTGGETHTSTYISGAKTASTGSHSPGLVSTFTTKPWIKEGTTLSSSTGGFFSATTDDTKIGTSTTYYTSSSTSFVLGITAFPSGPSAFRPPATSDANPETNLPPTAYNRPSRTSYPPTVTITTSATSFSLIVTPSEVPDVVGGEPQHPDWTSAADIQSTRWPLWLSSSTASTLLIVSTEQSAYQATISPGSGSQYRSPSSTTLSVTSFYTPSTGEMTIQPDSSSWVSPPRHRSGLETGGSSSAGIPSTTMSFTTLNREYPGVNEAFLTSAIKSPSYSLGVITAPSTQYIVPISTTTSHSASKSTSLHPYISETSTIFISKEYVSGSLPLRSGTDWSQLALTTTLSPGQNTVTYNTGATDFRPTQTTQYSASPTSSTGKIQSIDDSNQSSVVLKRSAEISAGAVGAALCLCIGIFAWAIPKRLNRNTVIMSSRTRFPFYWVVGGLFQSLIFANVHTHPALKHRRWLGSTNSSVSGSEVHLTMGRSGSSLIGLVEIGTPGQSVYVQFDTAFDETVIQPVSQVNPVIGTGVGYDYSSSTSFIPITGINDSLFDVSTGVVLTETANETFNIGGRLYTDVTFGLLQDFSSYPSGQAMPFNGAAGVIGLSRDSELMYDLKNHLGDTEWVCALDSYRLGKNGTWSFGNIRHKGDIAWTEASPPGQFGSSWWSINVTAISAAGRKRLPLKWTAVVASEEQSLVWPQSLLDWYFEAIPSSIWSPQDRTYRYPCNQTLPDFVFSIGNGTFTIPGTYLPYQKDKNGKNCITIITGDNSTRSAILGYPFGAWWAELGVLVLDYENKRVGFANKLTPLPAFRTEGLPSIDDF
ncbi:DNA-directed RNA polymerase II subunit RPB1, putative [Talaromyces stipitatus ATCC 10500]|uniref:DNA-directed RNA polymerase II subunit RPB1, putative n=1 Tax=Talaromyces stipitatus (strain ATCC 10500 / CBS 375.48 / QM 6759 / NRRL 1006) TaxID=441959 RepID=B8LX72_TALSN|nr:DNA-directed RNA polymerase II subunit RPB1, putative [Talaromyces stipitatus ATCC 10500]EED22722.1 DNA-directed RNA polymerase II subunit RPB1, putative [Talaromyces stipitatus ATCC 10500]